MNKTNIWQRTISMILAFAMVFGILPTGVFAAGSTGDAMVADPSTADTYKTMLGTDAEGNRYAGRIWTDKSVFAQTGSENLDGIRSITYDDDEFLVVYSTLGSTTSVTTEKVISGNLDVVVVLDNSASMGNYTDSATKTTRLETVRDAANDLIAGILEESTNRLSVITYSTNARTILPLNFYEKNSNVLSVSIKNRPNEQNGNAAVTSGDGVMSASATILGTGVSAGTSNDGYQMGTNLQSAINAAMKTLYSADNTDGRIPVLIVLTDGVADMAVTSGMLGDTTNSSYTHPISNQIGAGVALSTLLNAAYWKYLVSTKYQTDAVVYTVGVDIGDSSDAFVVMDPAEALEYDLENISVSHGTTVAGLTADWYEEWATYGTYEVRYQETGSNNGRPTTVTNTWTFGSVSADIFAGVKKYFEYSNEYFNVTNAELSDAFDDILTRISDVQDAFQAITDTVVSDGDTPQAYVDFIGDYMQVNEFKGVTIYGKFYEVTEGASAAVTNDDGTVTVTTKYIVGEGSDAITDPVTGEEFYITDVIDIEVIHTYEVDGDGNRTCAGDQELWIHILEEAMPLICHEITSDANGITYSVTEELPMRVYYTVGISDYIAPSGTPLLHRVDEAYLEANTDPVTGEVLFYSNQYYVMNSSDTGFGDAHTSATPNEKNRYYFHQANYPIFSGSSITAIEAQWDSSVAGYLYYNSSVDGSYTWRDDLGAGEDDIMTYGDYLNAAGADSIFTIVGFYRPTEDAVGTTTDNTTVYSGEAVAYLVEALWEELVDCLAFYDSVNGVYINGYDADAGTFITSESQGTAVSTAVVEAYITANGLDHDDIQLWLGIGTWRIPRLHHMTIDKTENITGTADVRVAPALDDDSQHEGSMVAWLGNNGLLRIPSDPPKTVYNAAGDEIDGELVMIGDVLTYQIEATNHESSAATITITDKVPTGTEYVEGSSNNGSYDPDTGVITWVIENVKPDETVTVTFKVTVTDASVDTIDNTAYIQVGNDPAYETNTTTNPPSGKTSTVTPVAGSNGVQVGTILTYNIYYYNTEAVPAAITVRDTIPYGTSYVDGSATGSGTGSLQLTTDESGAVTGLTWTISSVPAHSSGVVSFQVVVTAAAESTVENTATIQIGNNIPLIDTNTTVDQMTYGDLLLTKKVAAGNADGSSEKYFTLVLQSGNEGGSYLNGTYTVTGSSQVTEITFTDGVAEIQIRHDEAITIQNLPAGISISVFERKAGGYTPSYSVDEQTIAAGETVRIDVTNTYNVTSTSVTMEGTKTLIGRDLAANEFSFTVYDSNGQEVSTGRNGANGTITFKPITYTEAGVYTYTVTEVNSGMKGVTYDTTEFTVTVTVTDNGEGELVASVSYPDDGISFTNTYKASSTSITLVGTKTLTGRDLQDGEFSFVVTDANGDIVTTGENEANGTITFKPITYTEAGVYIYTVEESNSGLSGVTFDAAKFTVTVTVIDDGEGSLVATVSYSAPIAFSNSYKAGSTSVTLEGSKTLTGRDLQDGEFSFVVTDKDGNIVTTGENEADGTITFKPITYTEAGIYTYTVTEVNSGMKGVTYDGSKFTVTVTVIDDGKGSLVATVSYSAPIAFANSYKAGSTSVTLVGTKTLTGRDLRDGEFSFVVTDKDGNIVTTGENEADGTITFKPITYTDAGVYTYTVEESNSGLSGITYDTAKFTVTVTVVDDGNGSLVTTVSYSAPIAFANSYKAGSTSVTLEGSKTLTGRDLQDGEFSFVVTDTNGNIVTTGENEADGTITFKPITYTDAGVYTYTVEESNSGLSGITYDTAKYTVTVTVVDDGKGSLVATVSYSAPIAFVNSYKAGSTSVTLEGTKTLTGRDLQDGEFSFVVTDKDGNIVTTGENEADGTITFKPITYTDAGVYTYTVSEVASGLSGVTYDAAKYTVTVTVIDDGKGSLVATVSYSAPIAFANSYKAGSTSVTLEGSKTLTGRELQDGEFSFVVTDANGNIVTTGENEADGTITFKPITYTDAGVYTYTVTEVNSGMKGVSYDTAKYTVTVTVVDDGKGSLVATVSYSAPIAFVNSYKAGSTSVTLVGTKILTGRDLGDGEFSFVVTDKDGNIVTTGENEADGTITFKPITYTDAGIYTYTIREVGSNAGGIRYDASVFTVTVTVTDDGNGQLVASAVYSADVVFTNYYDTDATSVTLEGTKVLNGREMADNEFSFVVTDKDGNVVSTGLSKADGKIVFTPIGLSEVGVFTYTVSEVIGHLGGVSYSDAVYTVTVTVTDDGEGSLVASVKYSAPIAFTNSYKSEGTSVTLEGTKVLTGRTMVDNEFSFIVTDKDGNVVSTGLSKADGKIVFTPIGLTEVGVYTYTVSEVIGHLGGVSYSDAVYTVTVTVTDDGEGSLVASVKYSAPIVFTNSYKSEGTSVTLEGTKVLNGREMADNEFSFIVTDQDGNVVSTGLSKADGKIVFTPIGLSEAGVYTYTVSEVAGHLGGVIYSTAIYQVTVTVTDNGAGELVASVKYSAPMVFVNTYKTGSASITLEGTKTLTGRTMVDNEFSFVVTDLQGNVVSTGLSKADGEIVFTPIGYTEEGTYYYTVSEVIGHLGGVSYSDAVFTVTVTVTDDGAGELVTSVKYSAPIAFTNSYKSESTSVTLEGSKVLTGRTMVDNEFSFIVTDKDGNVVSTGLSKADGKIVFTPIGFNEAGVYTYSVSEVIGHLGGVSYSDAVYTVTVTVTDNGEGSLVASVKYSAPIVFTNTYVPGGTSVILEGTKVLTGRTMDDNEFSFIVTDKDGNVVSTGLSKADGKIVFTPIGFNEAGVYTYTVSEVVGHLGGVSYSDAVYTVTVTVTDNGEGSLVASVSYSAPVVFTNTYTPGGISVTLEGTKTLTGRSMADNEFSFVVKDEKGNVVSTGLSKADGKIVFTPIGFNEVGVYTYTVSEIIGHLGGVSYSDAVYTVTVTVTDDGEGSLVASVSYSAPVMFTNTYKADSTSYIPAGSKILTGRTMADNEFSFIVKDEKGNVVSTGLSNAKGIISFTAIGYTAPGTYTYTVSEVAGHLGGVTYDTRVFTFTVEVVDDGEGNLIPTASYPEPIVFTNNYTSAPVDVQLNAFKTLSGKTLAADEFTFVLTDEAGNVVTAVNAADGTVSFGTLTFTQAGTYVYTVSEQAGSDSRYTYDATVYTVLIEVRDNGAGSLYASVTYQSEGAEVGAIHFYNSYTPAPITLDLNDEIDFTKTVQDTAGTGYSPAGFRFEVRDWNGQLVSSGTSDVNGHIDFEPDLQFTMAGDYRFRVEEVESDAAGITTDETVWIVHVVVSYDNASGELSVTQVAVHKQNAAADHAHENEIEFINVYDPDDVTVEFSLNKTLTGRDLLAGEFTFVLTDENGNVIAEATNDASGKVFFSMTYDQVGTYNYTVSEAVGNRGGVTYDGSIYNVTVVVTDVDAQLTGTVTSGSVTFVNHYEAKPVSVELNAEKILSGRDLQEGEFTFILVDGDGTPITATNAADGTVHFGTFEYTEAGTYTYTLSEIAGTLGGITYSSRVYTVTVEVTDDLEGQLMAQVSYTFVDTTGTSQSITIPVFRNFYEAQPVYVTLEARKDMVGRPLAEGEFEFVLSGEGVELTATNAADGSVSFGTLEFTEAGTYVYTVTETDNGLGGVAYDDTVYTVTVVVTDDLKGNLQAQVTVNDDQDLVFENTYTADPVSVQLEAAKTLVGRDLQSGEFTFVLLGDDGSYASTGNAADGGITFDLSFTEAGTYSYTVAELNEGAELISYDETEHTVVIVVADNGQGSLYIASVSVDGDELEETGYVIDTGIEFINHVTDGNPKTGDASVIGLMAMMALGSMAALIVLIIGKKKLLA